MVELRLDVPNRRTADAPLEVRFILPEGVEPMDWAVSGGELSYDPPTGTLYWTAEVPPQAKAEMLLRVRLSRSGSYHWQVELKDGTGGVFKREAVTLVSFRLYLPTVGRATSSSG